MALKLYFKFEIEKGGGEMKGGGVKGGEIDIMPPGFSMKYICAKY